MIDKTRRVTSFLLVLSSVLSSTGYCVSAEGKLRAIELDPSKEMKRLLHEEDTDRDGKITIDDRGDQAFLIQSRSVDAFELRGTYFLSNLLQEFKLAVDRGGGSELIDSHKIFENPVSRISRSIRELYWDGLTRRIDREHLSGILTDSKIKAGEFRYLYVPHGDTEAFEYFSSASRQMPKLRLKVERLPKGEISPEYFQALRNRHGLLSLALRKNSEGVLEGVPFVVPGGRFNEMYGWDSYFEALGLLADGRVDLARAMVDNFVYQIENYGKILNANRTYYLMRSQPPFLTSMIRSVYEVLPKSKENKRWLERALRAAIAEYRNVWMNPDHLTQTGLSRYFGTGHGIPPEVEPGHFDAILKPFARKHGLSVRNFQKKYESGKIREPELDHFFVHDQAVRESGHDTTYRWRVDGRDRCADFVTVDLNSLLYKFELDIARMIQDEFQGELEDRLPMGELSGSGKAQSILRSADWRVKADQRKKLILKYLWDSERGLFFDYDFVNQRRSEYLSATTFYPLWAFDPAAPEGALLSQEQAKKLAEAGLRELEAPGGVAATSARSLANFGDERHARQWDFPNGWAPHQMLVWQGLRNFGMDPIADRLTYKWLYTITRNAVDYNGTIPEKYDVQKRSHQVFAEYGNVGTQFSYITREGFGWMNASYQVGLKSISSEWLPYLERLVPPEWLK